MHLRQDAASGAQESPDESDTGNPGWVKERLPCRLRPASGGRVAGSEGSNPTRAMRASEVEPRQAPSGQGPGTIQSDRKTARPVSSESIKTARPDFSRPSNAASSRLAFDAGHRVCSDKRGSVGRSSGNLKECRKSRIGRSSWGLPGMHTAVLHGPAARLPPIATYLGDVKSRFAGLQRPTLAGVDTASI